jgi:hypothetical protein
MAEILRDLPVMWVLRLLIGPNDEIVKLKKREIDFLLWRYFHLLYHRFSPILHYNVDIFNDSTV